MYWLKYLRNFMQIVLVALLLNSTLDCASVEHMRGRSEVKMDERTTSEQLKPDGCPPGRYRILSSCKSCVLDLCPDEIYRWDSCKNKCPEVYEEMHRTTNPPEQTLATIVVNTTHPITSATNKTRTTHFPTFPVVGCSVPFGVVMIIVIVAFVVYNKIPRVQRLIEEKWAAFKQCGNGVRPEPNTINNEDKQLDASLNMLNDGPLVVIDDDSNDAETCQQQQSTSGAQVGEVIYRTQSHQAIPPITSTELQRNMWENQGNGSEECLLIPEVIAVHHNTPPLCIPAQQYTNINQQSEPGYTMQATSVHPVQPQSSECQQQRQPQNILWPGSEQNRNPEGHLGFHRQDSMMSTASLYHYPIPEMGSPTSTRHPLYTRQSSTTSNQSGQSRYFPQHANQSEQGGPSRHFQQHANQSEQGGSSRSCLQHAFMRQMSNPETNRDRSHHFVPLPTSGSNAFGRHCGPQALTPQPYVTGSAAVGNAGATIEQSIPTAGPIETITDVDGSFKIETGRGSFYNLPQYKQ